MYTKKPKTNFNSDIIFTCQRRLSVISTKTIPHIAKVDSSDEHCVKKEEEDNGIFIKRYNSLKTKQPDKHFSNDFSELLSTKADEFLICRTNLIRSKIFAKKEQIDNVSYDLEDVSDLELNSDNDV